MRGVALCVAFAGALALAADEPPGIAAQPLAAALAEFAERTGLQVVYATRLADGVRTDGAAAFASPREALDALLAGTGLRYAFVNDRTVTIESESTPRGENTMTTDATLQQEQPAAPAATGRAPSLFRRIAGAVAGFALAMPLAAQETGAAAEDADMVEEVIVTATYRDTALMDTPIAISAVTDVDIVQKGIRDIHTLYTSIPGFNYKSSTVAYNILSIRGITPFAGGPSPVGAYLNNMPIGSTRGDSGHFRLGMFDMERVEVLKGPQGTLYGEGAMGGAIRYITKQPDTSGFDYSFRGSAEDMAHSAGLSIRVDAMVNVPLGERLALRATVYNRDDKGLIDAPGLRDEKDVNWLQEGGGRVTLALDATDDLRLTAMAYHVEQDMGGPGIAFHCYDVLRTDVNLVEVPDYPSPGVDCRGDHNAQFGRDPYITHKTHPHIRGLDRSHDDYTMLNLGVEWELPFADLIGSWSAIERDWRGGNEEAPPHVAFLKGIVERSNCFGRLPEGVCNVAGRYSSQSAYGLVKTWSDRMSYELRLVSNTPSRLQWTVGTYFKDDSLDRGDHSPCPPQVPYASAAPGEHCFLQWLFHPDTPVAHQAMIAGFLNTVIFAGNRSKEWTEDRSFFGEVSYRLSDQWEVAVGARHAHVQVRVDTLDRGINPDNSVLNTFTLDDDKKISPKVTVTWRPQDDLMLYGTWSHGFRPGVVQSRLVAIIAQLDDIRAGNPDAEALYQQLVDAQTVNGDEAKSLELGVKTTLADGRLSVTGALYHIDWEDIIVRTSATTPAIQGLVPFPLSYDDNAGSAESQGMELEVRSQFSDTLGLALGTAWMWTADIGTASTGNVARVEGSTAVGVHPGNRLPASPEFTGYASLDKDFALMGFDATARVDAYMVTKQFRGGDNERATPGYETVNLSLMLQRDDYWLGFYIRNAFDEVVAYERNQQGYVFGRARTIGVEFNYSLDKG